MLKEKEERSQKKMRSFDFAVVGAGAAGMSAAIACKQRKKDAEVVILEKKSELGKKILATGNGRCNVSNVRYEHYKVVKKLLDDLGLLLKEEEEGRLYPYSGSAKDVRDLLELKLNLLGVSVCVNVEVAAIELNADGNFVIKYKNAEKRQSEVLAKKILIATGGKAAPQYGSSGDGYVFAKSLGHSVTKLRPVLTPFVCKDDTHMLKGVRAFAKVKLLNKKSGEVYEEQGEVQFTDYGISGICVFNLSRGVILKDLDSRSRKEAFSDYEVLIDFMPKYEFEEIQALILQRFLALGDMDKRYLLTGFVCGKLAEYILNKNWQIFLNEGKEEFVKKITSMLKTMKLGISELRGWNYAQCTGGGIKTSELYEHFESKIVSGLYFAGEILDYDAICGGYNLSNAFFSGVCVGSKVAECIE